MRINKWIRTPSNSHGGSSTIRPIPILLTLMTLVLAPIATTGLHTQAYAAKNIVVDGNPSDWTGAPPATENNYTYSNSEWIWSDAADDIQDLYTALSAPSTVDKADLLEIRITSNTTHLFLLIRFPSLSNIGTNYEPTIFIAVDEDHKLNSGTLEFGLRTNTNTSADGRACWERLIIISLSSPEVTNGTLIHGDGKPFIEKGGGGPLDILPSLYPTPIADLSTNKSAFVASSKYAVVEAAIAWSDLGIDPAEYFAGGNYLRLTIITVMTDTEGTVISSLGQSATIDAVSNLTTTAEVDDKYVDYYVDVWFTSDPLPVSEPSFLGFVVVATLVLVFILFAVYSRVCRWLGRRSA